MKKTLIISLLLMTAVMGQAQVKIAPQLTKGMKMVYENVMKTNMAGTEMTGTSELVYEVSSVTADGAIINVTMTKMETAGGDEMTRTLMNLADNALKGVTMEVKTDKDGCAKSITNYIEVKKKCTIAIEKFIDDLLAKNPQVAQMMPKATLMKQAESSLTEEVMLRGIAVAPTSALVLNGRTVRNMMEDTYTNEQNIKMKRMFFVTNGGKTITTNAKADMSNDELKAFIIKQVEQSMPDQADMIKQNIDAVIASGMLKIEATTKAVYEMQDNGWMKSASVDNEMNMMGQKIKVNSIQTLK